MDLRKSSPTFNQWRAHELSAEDHLSFYLSREFSHGFASLEDRTVFFYQRDGKYNPKTDTGIKYDEPEIWIDWLVKLGNSIHSERDLKLMSWSEYTKYVEEHNENKFGGIFSIK